MSRLHITLLLFLFSVPLLRAQQFEVCMDVTSSGGGVGFQGNRYFAWTIGEPFMTTIANGGFLFTQGFHQPDPCGKSLVGVHDLADWGLSLFPNPTDGFMTLRFDPDKKGVLLASAYNLLGHLILDRQELSSPEGNLLDASSWPPGIYLLQLQDPVTKASATLRVVRI
ncbi:MAG TPA: T9SS type A sorting domain-containing protein [Saprospiraceae bacterium]|nr:T9SS type A sorting domain-containing protein [Saprospiraceae bacterium]